MDSLDVVAEQYQPALPNLDQALADRLRRYFPSNEHESARITAHITAILRQHRFHTFARLANIAQAFTEYPDFADRESNKLTTTERIVWSKLRAVEPADHFEYDQVTRLFSSIDITIRTPLEPLPTAAAAITTEDNLRIPKKLHANLKGKASGDPAWQSVIDIYFDERFPVPTLKDPTLVKDGSIQCAWCDNAYKCFSAGKFVFQKISAHIELHKKHWPPPSPARAAHLPLLPAPPVVASAAYGSAPAPAVASASHAAGKRSASSQDQSAASPKRVYKQQQLPIVHRPRTSLVAAPLVVPLTDDGSSDVLLSSIVDDSTPPPPTAAVASSAPAPTPLASTRGPSAPSRV